MPKKTISEMLVLIQQRQRQVPLKQRMESKVSRRDATNAVKKSNDWSKSIWWSLFLRKSISMAKAEIKSFIPEFISILFTPSICLMVANDTWWDLQSRAVRSAVLVFYILSRGTLGSFPSIYYSLKKCGSSVSKYTWQYSNMAYISMCRVSQIIYLHFLRHPPCSSACDSKEL